MKKKYFIQFDYWDKKNTLFRFYCGIITHDLSDGRFDKFCLQIIEENNDLDSLGLCIEDICFKVNSLNNIET